MLGGVGMRRGRRDPDTLRPGDALDFWRVEAVDPGRTILLRAEMKLPGKGGLRFTVSDHGDGRALLGQTAYFAPKGLYGFLYWYALYPLHAVIFSGLIREVAKGASRA